MKPRKKRGADAVSEFPVLHLSLDYVAFFMLFTKQGRVRVCELGLGLEEKYMLYQFGYHYI